jgi:hypothetical protein
MLLIETGAEDLLDWLLVLTAGKQLRAALQAIQLRYCKQYSVLYLVTEQLAARFVLWMHSCRSDVLFCAVCCGSWAVSADNLLFEMLHRPLGWPGVHNLLEVQA